MSVFIIGRKRDAVKFPFCLYSIARQLYLNKKETRMLFNTGEKMD